MLMLCGCSGALRLSHSVDLRWNAPVDSRDPVVGYNVYRAASGSGRFREIADKITNLSYTDHTVLSGNSYDYMVKSVDKENVTSLPSNVITIVVPK